MSISTNLFVITGGPGAGKTTLLNEIERRGFACSQEVARQIIQEQVKSGGDAVPWGNTARYAELMLKGSIEEHQKCAATSQVVFMDRGIPDIACYARLIRLPMRTEMRVACTAYRYNRKVFIAPPWEEIYAVDSERRQTWDEAIETYRQMKAVYEEYDYEPVEIPKLLPVERAEFVLSRMKEELAERESGYGTSS